MSEIQNLLATLAPNEVEMKTLGEAGVFVRGNGLLKADLTDAGLPAIHYGEIHTHYGPWTKETKSFAAQEAASKLRYALPGDLVVATTSEDDEGVARATAWLGDENAAVSSDAFIYRHSLDPMYASYFFQSTDFQRQKARHITGTKVRRISDTALKTIRIPVPPLPVQEAIGKTLDRYRSLERELARELESEAVARTSQYRHYRAKAFSFPEDVAVRWSTLGEVSSKVSSGGTPSSTRADYYGGEIPWLRTQEVDFAAVRTTGVTITEAGLKNSAAKWIPEHCVIVAMYGATAAKVAVNDIPLTTNQACCNLQIDPAQARYQYVFHWIASQYDELRALGEGSQSNLNAKKVKAFPIPIPSLEEQDRVVEIIDQLDELTKDLRRSLPDELAARRQQYEHYRDQLFTFPEVES